ncbi:Nonsense-mediated mRNA decay protein 3 [Cyberlindnera fabianii]|uniref:Nonsense-mediated mRNA decay protein 3 n=1 Tax=Cyberlindnera fabianii TaxID=36022 RepID=A0A1V2L7W6_CYBFA|nr:Nonsense-mediated mRNA decay protein 3 [Cyberlindnera fabianii]
MDISSRRPPLEGPMLLTREDFEKQQQQQQQQKKKTISAKSIPNASEKMSNGEDKQKRKRTRNKAKKNKGVKVVVRLLPPNLEADDFFKTTAPLTGPQAAFDSYYIKGHYPTKPFKEPEFSRVYISFKTPQHAEKFSKQFKDHAFEDDKESFVPNITASLLAKMPDSQEKLMAPKTKLQDLPEFKNQKDNQKQSRKGKQKANRKAKDDNLKESESKKKISENANIVQNQNQQSQPNNEAKKQKKKRVKPTKATRSAQTSPSPSYFPVLGESTTNSAPPKEAPKNKEQQAPATQMTKNQQDKTTPVKKKKILMKRSSE